MTPNKKPEFVPEADKVYSIKVPLTRPVQFGDAEYRGLTMMEPTAGAQIDAYDTIPAEERPGLTQAHLEQYLAAWLCGVPVGMMRRVALNDYRTIVGHIGNFPYSQATATTSAPPSLPSPA